MTKPSIAILGSRGIPARYGGFETFAEELSTRLAARGYDVIVYCETGAADEQPTEYRGVRLEYVASPRLGPLSTIVFDLKCIWRARRNVDIVYMLGYGAALFCFIPRLYGRATWINMDGIEWIRSKWSVPAKVWLRFMEMMSTKTASLLVADADGIRDHLADRYSRLPETSVIPYGAPIIDEMPSTQPVLEYGIEPDGYYLVVCRMEPENHVLEIILGHVRSESKLPLVVVGDVSTKGAYVDSLLHHRGKHVKFVGTIFDAKKLQALRWHCRAYFHGHSVGGTNPSLLEALGCGNRVIAHDNVFNREVADRCGMYFTDSGDIPAIVKLLDNEPNSGNTRAPSFARVRSHYDWNAIADSYEHLMNRSRSMSRSA